MDSKSTTHGKCKSLFGRYSKTLLIRTPSLDPDYPHAKWKCLSVLYGKTSLIRTPSLDSVCSKENANVCLKDTENRPR